MEVFLAVSELPKQTKKAAANLYRPDAVSGALNAKVLPDSLRIAVDCAAKCAGIEVVAPVRDVSEFGEVHFDSS